MILRTYYILFLFFILTASITKGQFLDKQHYKHQTTLQVLENIARGKGDNRSLPILKISEEPQYIAKYFPGSSNHFIYIDEKVYDLCVEFEEDSLSALACIVGHELGHFFENHASNFGFSDDSDLHSNEELEDKADRFGLFYGAIAGYKTHLLFPKILTKIYENYHLSEHLKGYPPLEERKKIVLKAITEVEGLVNIYQFGQNLYSFKQYEAAHSCLNYILNHFPSKLIHNNLGVCKLNIYLNKITDQSLYPYIYPFEFDVRVKKKVKTNLIHRDMQFDTIDEAIEDFKTAIDLDPHYETAYINLACAYSIRGNQDAASGTIIDLQQHLQEINKSISENAYLIQGISRALNENYKSAESIFKHLHSDSDINNYNKKVLMAEMNKEASYYDNFVDWVNSFFEETPEVSNKKIVFDASEEKIDNTLPEELQLDKTYNEIDLGNWAVLYYKDDGKVGKYIFRNKTTEVLMIQAFDSYQESTSKGISIYDSIDKVKDLEHYGAPTFLWNDKPYMILNYQDAGLGFTFEKNRVVNWFRWTINH
ncbi:hypothetical protein KMW28_16230 [Flammeovirga yaeyamensis]|uniref:Peptidase M48 domain-containing protein n=1 Tax=Flammeovirga yaeyamensis TaxID=367791 RepID=A0AAX1N115_9BACT|nr:hypothetical protein [Flammeovirga yaeyamensis]MBB3698441.1 tetratricopeptide (TPR) repeat protein [Flammeovirga yaeyamensis]NMF34209.1 hypothetical protein [Flammeovirga yaeyamensis]QWG01194.1 hypothetical protein KMW28_16230 [Flammeovirga yaeyamensis]